MQYKVYARHYCEGRGNYYTEQLETGHSDEFFTAEDWNVQDGIWFHPNEVPGFWVKLYVKFWEDDADIKKDKPIKVDVSEF